MGMDSANSIINYNPVDALRLEIRLVVLMPAPSFEADIHCKLHHVFLHDKPTYDALSYAWGDPNITSEIFVQSQPFQATSNLVSALRHLRRPDLALFVWVDAIAINQRDLQERSQQVALMGEIYKSARYDLLWLGPETKELSHAFQIFGPYHGWNFFDAAAPTYTISSESAWSIILQNSPVWQRLWVIQELVFSKDILLVCGHKMGKWQSQVSVIEPGTTHDPKLQIQALRSGRRWDLLSLWTRFRHYQCTDPRDRLFSIMGIAEDTEVLPDYKRPTHEVFRTIAKALILRYRNLDVLNYCRSDSMIEVASRSRTDEEFLEALPAVRIQQAPDDIRPSWVPDFANQRKLENQHIPGIRGIGNPTTETRLWGSSNLDDSYCPQWVFSEPSLEELRHHENSMQLRLNGIIIDEVDNTWRSNQRISETISVADSYVQLYKDLGLSMPKSWKYLNGANLHDAYWRTVFCDSIYGSRITPGYWRRRWKEYVRMIEGKPLGVIPRKLMSLSMSKRQKEENPSKTKEIFQEFESSLPINSSYNFTTTSRGYFALVPCETLPGDLVCGLEGGYVPYILRRVTENVNGDTMAVVGPAYIHELMDGGIIKLRDEKKLQQCKIVLV
jgi:hypothetical protein